MVLSRWLFRCFGVAVGKSHTSTCAFTATDVQTFGDLINDHNPVHFHKEKAVATGFFTDKVVHGMLVASIFSHMFGTYYPGSIYMMQTLKFTRPVYLDELVEGKTTIKEIQPSKKGMKCVLTTTVTKVKDRSVAIEGEATILIPDKK